MIKIYTYENRACAERRPVTVDDIVDFDDAEFATEQGALEFAEEFYQNYDVMDMDEETSFSSLDDLIDYCSQEDLSFGSPFIYKIEEDGEVIYNVDGISELYNDLEEAEENGEQYNPFKDLEADTDNQDLLDIIHEFKNAMGIKDTTADDATNEQYLKEDEDWRSKLLPLGSKEAYQKIDDYTANEYGIYTKNAQYWPDNKNVWRTAVAENRAQLEDRKPLSFTKLEFKSTIEEGEFEGNPIFIFSAEEIRKQLKSNIKNTKLDLLKQYNVNANKNYETKIDLANSNSIKILGRIKNEYGFAYIILFRDKFNNIYRYESPEKYSIRQLRLVTTITGRIDPDSIKEINAELGETPILSMNMITCNLDIQLEDIEELPPKEAKARMAQINSTKYALVREEVIRSQDSFHVDKKLDSYYKEDEITGQSKLVNVSPEKWKELAEKADSFYKSNNLRQKRDRWAVTDGNCIFANAATALLYYGEDIKHGSLLYGSCDGNRGTHNYNDDRWRYATSNEIRNAKPIHWN